jgi:hypothetical protein
MTQHHRSEVLSALLDNDLEPETKQEVESHVAACADCRQVLEELRALRSATAELEQLEPSPETWYAIRRRVAPARRLRSVWIWAGAATAAAVVLVAVLTVGRPGPARAPAGFAAMATAVPEVSRGLGDEYDSYLHGIDDALDEIREALGENPGNARVRMALYRAHQSKATALDRLTSGGY